MTLQRDVTVKFKVDTHRLTRVLHRVRRLLGRCRRRAR